MRRAEGSLIEFSKQAWQVIEPGTPFVDGWHLHAIADHLEAVLAGEIKDLIINMPPRHCKSIAVAVMWPVWSWIAEPSLRWLFASYAGSLSIRDSLKCRRLIQSPWFQERWGDKFELVGDQNAKQLFENSESGYRYATSVGASTTGHGGDVLCVDDPHNSLEAQSDAVRESTIEWWAQAMSTRLNNPRTGRRVVVMQRLHEADLTGHLLKEGGWDHLCLPARYEETRKATSIGWRDPRTKEGDLLWPAHFDEASLSKLELQLGDYGTAGQLQQRPAPKGGAIVQIKDFRLWSRKVPLPQIEFIVQSYDTAFTERTDGDPTACTVWGVIQVTKHGDRAALLLDAWTEHLGYPDLRERVIKDWNAKYGGSDKDPLNKPRKPDLILVEQKGSGQSLLQDLQAANVYARGYNPGKADKISRVHLVMPLLEAGCFYLMESSKNPGEAVTWAKELLDQLERFPFAEHDDLVDTVSQAGIMLRDAGHLELQRAPDDIIEESEYRSDKSKRNPYGS